jgi:hypothetical protein
LAPSNSAIEFSTHQFDDKLYIFAANKSSQKQTARFGGPFTGKNVRVLHEEHSTHVEGDRLSDTFEPFGVHVYCIE